MDNLYSRKITSYLDGSLSSDEHSEFEAFVRTHPEFEEQIKKKQEDLSLLKELIPAPQLSRESLQVLTSEMRQSVFNLLKPEPRNVMDKLKQGLEEWFSR